MLGGAAISVGAAKEAIGGFGPLEAVLGAISAVYVNSEVRSRPLAQNSSLTNQPTGIRRNREQD